MSLPNWVDENKYQLILGLFGLFLMGVGVWKSVDSQVNKDSSVKINHPDVDAEKKARSCVVDVGGAVEAPGVYELRDGSRINDALVMAGGLSAEADRAYVGRYLNLAEEIVDGMKIYVPFKEDPAMVNNLGEVLGVERISINRSTINELDSLWGVGEARAEQIVNGRPYKSIEELATKSNTPRNVLDRNMDKLSL
ncbi:SLBB domain-containing protein [Patescibacteria group bacterium]